MFMMTARRCGTVVIPAGLVSGGEPVPARLADGVAAPFVLVVRDDISDALVEPNRVVVAAHPFKLGGKYRGVADGEQADDGCGWRAHDSIGGSTGLPPATSSRCVLTA